MTAWFVAAIKAFAGRHRIPVVQFERGQRKDDVAKEHLARFRRSEGVVFIGVAQEIDNAFRSKPLRRKDGSVASFDFYRAKVPVNQYYFYILDAEWGPFFIKFSSYVPFGARLCINGHEWAKQQLRARLRLAVESRGSRARTNTASPSAATLDPRLSTVDAVRASVSSRDRCSSSSA